MILLPEYKNTHVAIFGIRRTGISALKSLIASGATTYAWDDSENALEKAQQLFPPGSGCTFIDPSNYNWKKISALILAPGIPTTFPQPHWIVKLAQKYGCPIKSDIRLFIEAIQSVHSRPKIIGITGTNGKSTTASLLTHVLNLSGISAELGGNIGIPALSLDPGKQAYVLEISSFQIDITEDIEVDASVLLNITPDHIDRHGTLENYIKSKVKLLEMSDIRIIGIDSHESELVYKNFKPARTLIPVSGYRVIESSFEPCFSYRDRKLYENGDFVAELDDLQINYNVNAGNIVAVYALVRKVFCLHPEQILKAIKVFKGLPHRTEFVGKFQNMTFVNDSKSTNADSSERTLLCYENIYWIVGGVAKNDGITPLLVNSQQKLAKIRKIFLIGESSETFAKDLKERAPWLDYKMCSTLECALERCRVEANKEENRELEFTVLLSPICASFDQFKNFEDRGDCFRKLVSKLRV